MKAITIYANKAQQSVVLLIQTDRIKIVTAFGELEIPFEELAEEAVKKSYAKWTTSAPISELGSWDFTPAEGP